MIQNQSITFMNHDIIKELSAAPFDDLCLITESGNTEYLSHDLIRRLYNDAVESMNSYQRLANDYREKYEAELSRNTELEHQLMELSE